VFDIRCGTFTSAMSMMRGPLEAVFFMSERSVQLGRVSDIPSKIYCHALALGVGFSHSEKTLMGGGVSS
jgi:hypothetical protein